MGRRYFVLHWCPFPGCLVAQGRLQSADDGQLRLCSGDLQSLGAGFVRTGAIRLLLVAQHVGRVYQVRNASVQQVCLEAHFVVVLDQFHLRTGLLHFLGL